LGIILAPQIEVLFYIYICCIESDVSNWFFETKDVYVE
jgi:hypothetical protein